MVCCTYQGAIVYNLNKNVFLSLNIFILAKNEDPDDMLQNLAFHVGLHCLPKYSFRSYQYTVNSVIFTKTLFSQIVLKDIFAR